MPLLLICFGLNLFWSFGIYMQAWLIAHTLSIKLALELLTTCIKETNG